MPPTEPAPYQPTVADIERRDDAERKQHAAYLDELRAVTQKARAEGRDRERERVAAIVTRRLDRRNALQSARAELSAVLAAVRTGKDPDR